MFVYEATFVSRYELPSFCVLSRWFLLSHVSRSGNQACGEAQVHFLGVSRYQRAVRVWLGLYKYSGNIAEDQGRDRMIARPSRLFSA